MQNHRKTRVQKTSRIVAMAMALALAAVCVVGAGAASTKSRSSQVLTPQTFIDLAKQVRPAVVSIKINAETLEKLEQWQRERRARPRAPQRMAPGEGLEGLDELDIPDWVKEFFKSAPGLRWREIMPEEDVFRYPYGAGSGMIVRSDGYVLTNRHVLYHPILGVKMYKEGQITVVLADGRKFTGDQVKVVATDQLTDLAVLKIEATGLPTVKWGDSDAIEVGEWVMAIGDPLELTGSVSQGIISGKAREVEIAGYAQLIQTDAMINPGNSGGPLVNLDGEVIGVNQMIASTTRLWSGVGFAIPSNIARKVAEDLIEKGHPVRGYIGIRMTDPDTEFPALAAHEGYEGKNGVGVVEVYEGYPAAKAGIKPYDIIVAIDGKEVESNTQVQRLITAHKPGEKIEFKIFRGGKFINLTVIAGDWPSEEKLLALGKSQQKLELEKPKEKAEPEKKGRIGIVVANHPEDPNAPEESKGVAIKQVQAGSAAAAAGLQVGDVILEVEKRRVRDSEEFMKVVNEALARLDKSKKQEKGLLMRVQRGDRIMLVPVMPSAQ
ncbi:MAG: PDZ domain-containing protein [Candidatus Sumerlaeia bacterium]|nr:PDZ domain-containing protein [Candidatus Sumerlaeia bacterium]